MTEQEAREIVKVHGWSFLLRERRSRSYVYAARKVQGKRLERYIGSSAMLVHLTRDRITAKLEIL